MGDRNLFQAEAEFADRLLRGGVAPRHVHRSIRELRDHRDDLVEQFLRQECDEAEAHRNADQIVGNYEVLAGRILERPELRSKARRFAWLLFGLGPMVASVAGTLCVTVLDMGITQGAVFLPRLLALWLVPIVASVLLSHIALQRRMSALWPVVSIAAAAISAGATLIEPQWVHIGSLRFFDGTRATVLAAGLLLFHVWIARISSRTS